MRNKLLATVALSAAIGYATLAAAQNAPSGSQTGRETLSPKGAEPHMKTAPQGAMTPRHGSQSAQTETAPSGQAGQQPIPEKIQPKDEGANAQSEHGSSAAERRSQKDELQRGAQKDEFQHGAQNENSERGGMNAAHERTGEGTETKANGPGGKSAQLSVEQRTKIKGIIGRGHVARVDHPDFSVRVRDGRSAKRTRDGIAERYRRGCAAISRLRLRSRRRRDPDRRSPLAGDRSHPRGLVVHRS